MIHNYRNRNFKIGLSLMTIRPSNRGKFVMLSLLVGGIACFLYMRHKQEWLSFWIKILRLVDRQTDRCLISSPDSALLFKADDFQSFAWKSIISEVRQLNMSALLGLTNSVVSCEQKILSLFIFWLKKFNRIKIWLFFQKMMTKSTMVESRSEIELQDWFEISIQYCAFFIVHTFWWWSS